MIQHLALAVAAAGSLAIYRSVLRPLFVGCLASWLVRRWANSRADVMTLCTYGIHALVVAISITFARSRKFGDDTLKPPDACGSMTSLYDQFYLLKLLMPVLHCADFSWLSLEKLAKASMLGFDVPIEDATGVVSAISIIVSNNAAAISLAAAAAWYTWLTVIHPFDAIMAYVRRGKEADLMVEKLCETYSAWWKSMLKRAAFQCISSLLVTALCVPDMSVEASLGVLLLCFVPLATPEIMLVAAVYADHRLHQRFFTLCDLLPIALACYNWFFWNISPFGSVPHQHAYWVTLGMTIGWASYGALGMLLSVGLGAIPFIVFFDCEESKSVSMSPELKLLAAQTSTCSTTPTTQGSPKLTRDDAQCTN